MLDLPLTIKNTCYGSMISGKSEDVYKAIEEIRKLDPNHIFTKERGFAPGDPRRCRGHLKLWKILKKWNLKRKNQLMLTNLKRLWMIV